MYPDEDVIIIETSPDDEPRNARAVPPPRGRTSRSNSARVYRASSRRRDHRRPQHQAMIPAPAPAMPYHPGHPPPMTAQPYPYPGPHPSPYPFHPSMHPMHPMAQPSMQAIPIGTLADGVSLAADGIAALIPLPDQPPTPTGSPDVDLANQNEHRHALAAHDKTGQRIRAGGRVLSGLLKMLFGEP